MPYSYTDPNQVDRQHLLSQQLMRGATQPMGSPLANLLTGLAGGMHGMRAQNAQEGNQQYRQDFMANMPQDPAALSQYLLGSHDPEMQEMGMRMYASQPSDLDRRLKEAQIKKTEMEATKPMPSHGQKALDSAFAKDYASWSAGGGFADVEKQLVQLESVAKDLETRNDLTGKVIGRVPDPLKQAFGYDDAIAARDRVEEVVQRSLRAVLGAQFTQEEGKRLIERAYNPNLSEKENASRVRSLITQIRSMAKSKNDAARYFEQHGTLQGWSGSMPSFGEVNPDVDSSGLPPVQVDQGAGGMPEGRVAINPQTRERMIVRGGQLVPMQ